MAAPSSLQIIPSEIVISRATSQPSIACGPPSVDKSSGIVMKGPMPIMFVMLRAVASSRPNRRNRRGFSSATEGVSVLGIGLLQGKDFEGACESPRRRQVEAIFRTLGRIEFGRATHYR